MELASVLDDCLQRMHAGESIEECLLDYPDLVVELLPMLRAARTLESLAGFHLPDGERQRGRLALRRALVSGVVRTGLHAFMSRTVIRVLAGTAAALILVATAITTVAASQPGDLAYPVRLAAERSSVVLQRNPDARAAASLRLADARLAELDKELGRRGRANREALSALLAEDERLADWSSAMPPAAREEVAARVADHAARLESLADMVRQPDASEVLRQAAERARSLGSAIRAGRPGAAGKGPVSLVPHTATSERELLRDATLPVGRRAVAEQKAQALGQARARVKIGPARPALASADDDSLPDRRAGARNRSAADPQPVAAVSEEPAVQAKRPAETGSSSVPGYAKTHSDARPVVASAPKAQAAKRVHRQGKSTGQAPGKPAAGVSSAGQQTAAPAVGQPDRKKPGKTIPSVPKSSAAKRPGAAPGRAPGSRN